MHVCHSLPVKLRIAMAHGPPSSTLYGMERERDQTCDFNGLLDLLLQIPLEAF